MQIFKVLIVGLKETFFSRESDMGTFTRRIFEAPKREYISKKIFMVLWIDRKIFGRFFSHFNIKYEVICQHDLIALKVWTQTINENSKNREVWSLSPVKNLS